MNMKVLCSVILSAACLGAGASQSDGLAHCDWGEYLDVPPEYASFERKAEKAGSWNCGDILVEEYRQANGPKTYQRLMVAFPRSAKGKVPAIVVPFYYPEAMLGFNPRTGGLDCEQESSTNLAYYGGISYMSDLARRGYATISAEAYYRTYDRNDEPKKAIDKWRHCGGKMLKDHPSWTGIGKLLFDTRLLVDFIASDPRVASDRIGIIGHSLGGKMAFYTGCVDPRIKVIVASDFGIGWDQTNWNDIWYWGSKLNDLRAMGMDHAGLLSLSGGKPFCLIAGECDNEESGVIMRKAKGYEGHPERLLFINHATGHRPPKSATEAGYCFIDKYLGTVDTN